MNHVGKTVLLNMLCGRIPKSKRVKLYGSIDIDGFQNDSTVFRSSFGFVMQDDNLFSYLTVRETLTLAAYFHMPVDVSKEAIDEKVSNIIHELNLVKAIDTIIGSASRRGISGGERKRVAIGKELMAQPKILFLDEPTSSLDSFQAHAIMMTMKSLASSGRIVVSVIHQPRSSIFALIDLLLLLSEGRTMYFGPARKSVSYFSSLGYPCPKHYNPADFFLDIISFNARTEADEERTREILDHFASSWIVASTSRDHRYEEDGEIFSEINLNDEEEVKVSERNYNHHDHELSKFQANIKAIGGNAQDVKSVACIVRTRDHVKMWFISFSLLLWRANAETYRNYGALFIRAITGLFFAVLLALIYQNIGYNQRNIQDRLGLLYFFLINQVS
jgi:ATP-binding cassette, subfamily G (WHITE), eye pigment precursor transporter